MVFGLPPAMVEVTPLSNRAPYSQRSDIPKEDIEWCDIWLPHVNQAKLPHVLLIGDSISRGYYDEVSKDLEKVAYVDRLSTSAASGDPALYAQVDSVLGQFRYQVIHVNNGLHGWANREDVYAKGVETLLDRIRRKAHGAKLIWATTTPTRFGGPPPQSFNAINDRVLVRNSLANAIMQKEGIPIDDLFSLVKDHPEYWSNDGVHFNHDGYTAEANSVATSIAKSLAKP